MDKNYYTVIDIIFGLRPYYLDNEKQLKILKDLCYSLDKNVSDFYFYIEKNGITPQIYCKFIQNLKSLRGLVTYLQHGNNIYINGKSISKLNTNYDGSYFIDSDFYSVKIKKEDSEHFSLLVSQILNSEFVNNLKLVHYYDDKFPGIYIEPSRLVIDSCLFFEPVSLQYVPNTDKILVTGTKETTVYKEMIAYILNYKIPKELLSEYIIKLIENSDIDKKAVHVVNFNDSNNVELVNLNIKEIDNQILLERVNVKKKIRSKNN